MKDFPVELDEFASLLDETVEGMGSETDADSRFQFMAEGMKKLSGKVIEIGDFCEEKIQESPKTMDALPHYFLVFSWNEYAKSFLLLWRNIFF